MDDITFIEIKIFLTLAKEKNFTKAAKVLFVSQPLVTKAIKRLESKLSLKLFERNSKFVTLTMEGEFLYLKLHPIFNELSTTFEKVKIINSLSNPSIRIGALYGFNFENIILDYINIFEEKYKDIQVDFQIYNFEELKNNMDSLDIILTTNCEIGESDNYNYLTLNKVKIYVALSKEHKLCSKNFLTSKDIKNEIFYSFSEKISKYGLQYTKKACLNKDFIPNIVTVDNVQSIFMSVKRNKGIALANQESLLGFEKDVILKDIIDLDLEINKICAWKKDLNNKYAEKFIEILKG